MTDLDSLNAAVGNSGGYPGPQPAGGDGSQERLARLELDLARLREESEARSKRLSILVFSGSLDRLLAAFTIATGAAAMGIEVTMFFAFWGISAVRTGSHLRHKGLLERMTAAMLPSCPRRTNPSRWSFGGIGRLLFRLLMRRHNMMQIEELIGSARELGVRFVCCETSTALMGVRSDELMLGIEIGGVATYLDAAYGGRVALFV